MFKTNTMGAHQNLTPPHHALSTALDTALERYVMTIRNNITNLEKRVVICLERL